ncbi:LOW QUALITY PROTEIN: Golgi microtubule-associated protein [Leptinotarsa decemlineata]|uniref:LOW QUALITY PROTEIN: Golgi microtubule-associated protein n=1 Tax=Leptinotarsa decemlineata TaxID=7539 RepID=UPI003D307587
MSWLNLNEGFNSLKGQLTNFASNVLADDDNEGTAEHNYDYDKLKHLCAEQELQIQNLKRINEELKQHKTQQDDIAESNGNWNWETTERKASITSEESLSDLRSKVSSLESEKNDLLLRLEQLDSENEMNLSKVVNMRDKLQDELNDMKENYLEVKQQNKKLIIIEEKLKSELKELQLRLKQESEVSVDGEYKEKYMHLAEENRKLSCDLDESKKEVGVLKSSNETLQKVLDDVKQANEAENMKYIEKIKVLQSENKIIYIELQKAKKKLKFFEKKSENDVETSKKLEVILETYEQRVNSLKREVEDLKLQNSENQSSDTEEQMRLLQEELELLKTDKNNLEKRVFELIINHQDQIQSLKKEKDELKIENESLQLKANGRMDCELEMELDNIRKEHEAQLDILQEELEYLKKREDKTTTDENNVETLHDQIQTLERELIDIKEHNQELDAIHKKYLELHNRYVKIISENIKKFQECDKPSDLQQCSYEDDPQVAEFSKQVENIMKILLELRYKCESLEKKVMDLSEEKNNIISEKNHEIEKLLHNSDILSQEVLEKTQSLKEYKIECSELAKNNDLLISDLAAYKNNSVLQTISESNEDNVVLLESQLDNSNKRIEDLERIIDDYERQQMNDKGGNSDGDTDIIDKKELDHQRLLNNYDILRIEYDSLQSDLEAARDYLKVVTDENRELKFSLEKVKSDYENVDYQLSELHVNTDGLKEELVAFKKKTDCLSNENCKLKSENEKNKAISDDLKNEIAVVKEKLHAEQGDRKDLELQIRNLTEKLQISKMAETSLKLQYEQKSKEAVSLSESKYNLEISLNQTIQNLAEFQNKFEELQSQNDALTKKQIELEKIALEREERIEKLNSIVTQLEDQLVTLKNEESFNKLVSKDNLDGQVLKEEPVTFEDIKFDQLPAAEKEKKQIGDIQTEDSYNELKVKYDDLLKEKNYIQGELDKQKQLEAKLNESLNTCSVLEKQVQELSLSRNELVNIVTTKHQESVAYHNEIQRLTQMLTVEAEKYRNLEKSQVKNEEIEKLTDQNNFLKQKCEVMAQNLLEEQSKVQQLVSEKSAHSEREVTLQKKLERLQTHLVELEEHYTQELFQTEQKNASLQARVTEIEEREKSSSTIYTSVSIRANQQVESLQKQLQTVMNERDLLRKQISDAEDQNNKQAAALANLQFVLEQFRKDKEKDVFKETERIRRHIVAEKQVQEELKKEISNLKSQLEESNQGLLAASRLSDQLELSQKTISTLKEEVYQLQSKLAKSEDDLKEATSQTDGKVDKSLVKNLIIGFVTSNNNLNKDQLQILKIIATVLDFNQQDHDKVNLNKPQHGSWLSSLLGPQHGNPNKKLEESLSQAFVKFLENESKPRVVPSLLTSNVSEATKPTSSKSTTPRQTPIVLSEIVLPTFADFAQNRNSSSILKDVLKDSS